MGFVVPLYPVVWLIEISITGKTDVLASFLDPTGTPSPAAQPTTRA